MKLGVYVASYQQPVFLRHCLLQLLNQKRLPDVISIHENANSRSYLWAVEDIIGELVNKGVDVIHKHSPNRFDAPLYFCPALQGLIDADCDLYNKVDVDDIIYRDHLSTLVSLIGSGNSQLDYAMNVSSSVLALLETGGYKYARQVNFGSINPTGAHPNSIIFNRAVAEAFSLMMHTFSGKNDDTILAEKVLPNFKGNRVFAKPTMCYVAHGKNVSTAHWSTNPPAEFPWE